MTARIQALSQEADVPLLLSRELAAEIDRPVRSCGFHPMKGVPAPQEAFALVDGPAELKLPESP